MSLREPVGDSMAGRLRLTMLQETLDLAVEAAGSVWPTEAMALGSLFERGVLGLEQGENLPPLSGRATPSLLQSLNEAREDLYLVEAQYAVTRYATFRLTADSPRLEAIWIELADRHLAIRSQIVESRRHEEQLKRELSALGGSTVPLPEHDDLPMSDSNRPRKSRGMYSTLFEGASAVEVELDVAPPLLRLADTIAQARGWVTEWGQDAPLLLLAYGMSRALREREAERVQLDDDDSVREALDATRGRLMYLDGRYSTLRRRLFEMRHNNRILQWRITALEVEARAMQSRLDQFNQDRERLTREIAERRSRPLPPQEETAPAPQTSWRSRIARLFGASE